MSALDETLEHLADARRQLRGAHTSVLRARRRAASPDALQLLGQSVLELIRLVEGRLHAEGDLQTAPHLFVPGPDGWCFRCGGARDRTELHPPELQVTNHEGAALAAGGS